MLTNFIRFIGIYLCTIVLCLKIMNYAIKNRFYKVILTICPFLLSLTTIILKQNSSEFVYIAPLLILWILISVITSHPQETFISVMLGYSISYAQHTLVSFITLAIMFPIFSTPSTFPSSILAIFTTFLHILTTYRFSRIKRFKNGIPFLFLTNVINIATYVCLLFIALLTYLFNCNTNKPSIMVALFSIIFVLAFIIHWWQAQITKSYQHSLRLKELESLRIELREKDKQLKEISENNKQMGHIIHEDTKLLRTLLSGIEDYVSTDFEDKNSLKMKGDALLEVINNHSDDRLKSIRSINNQKYKSYSTNIEALNLQLNHFAKRAAAENVTLYVHIACDLESYIPHILCDTDLSHLLSNLLDNAFIATSYTANRIIQLQFYEVNKFFVIEIADSGIPFETESLVNFGLTQRTTHEDEGGSGMGLMEIWKIKEKLGATLHIEEYELPSPYSKKISFTFNRKNRFSIRSWRKDDIQQISRRIDLQTYDTSTF